MSFMLCQAKKSLDTFNQKSLNGFVRDNYLIQIKYDGARAKWTGDKFFTRGTNAQSWINRFKHIDKELLKLKDIELDGEIVVFDDKGRSDFTALQRKENWNKAIFVVFDVLRYKNMDTRNLKLEQRIEIMKQIEKDYGLDHRAVKFSKFYEFNQEFIDTLEEEKQEGIILKLKGTRYFTNRSWNWIKYKFYKETIANIIGFKDGVKYGYGAVITDKGNVGLPKPSLVDFYHNNKPKKVKAKYIEISEQGKMRFPIFQGWA